MAGRPEWVGPSTIIGRIEAPRQHASVSSSANLLVSGWAADTTATGWAGIDGVEVWNGASNKSGSTRLTTGTVGIARADVADARGTGFANSGFQAVVPASVLHGPTGAQTIYVYLHTPGKGTWYRTVLIDVVSTAGVNVPEFAPLVLTIGSPLEMALVKFGQNNNSS